MVTCASLFSQLLQQFPRWEFAKLVREHQAEKHAKGLSCWEQFVAMLFCQLAQAKSLREICGGLRCCVGKLKHLGVEKAPPRSTLSYANQHRPWELYRDLFYLFLDRCRVFAPQKKFRFKNKLLSLDATVIVLCLHLFPWAEFRRTKGAVKLHLLLDHDGYLPTYALLTEGKRHEVRVARQLAFAPESIVVLDRGYNDYALFGSWCAKRVWFVTRLKANLSYVVVERYAVPPRGNILADEQILLSSAQAQRDCPYLLRRVVVWNEKNQEAIVLLTNHPRFAASTIAAIYKDRWQIEIFFKTLKQNLKVKTFVGTSENALQIQIWTALLALLLLKFLQFRARLGWSLSNLAALLRWNLFTYRELWAWLDNPFATPPLEPRPEQLTLNYTGIGQHSP